jgi:hypothetical protein
VPHSNVQSFQVGDCKSNFICMVTFRRHSVSSHILQIAGCERYISGRRVSGCPSHSKPIRLFTLTLYVQLSQLQPCFDDTLPIGSRQAKPKTGQTVGSGSAKQPVMGREELAKCRSDKGKELYWVEPPGECQGEVQQQQLSQTTIPVPESTYPQTQDPQYHHPNYYQSAIPFLQPQLPP